MKLPIVLIGPMCSGKSTVAATLSKKLGVPHFPMDHIRAYYYLKQGLDLDEEEGLREGDDFRAYVEFIRPYEITALEQIMKEPEFRKGIIHLGAGHSCYEDEEFLQRAKNALANSNVILLMPSPDIKESARVLESRLKERMQEEANKNKLQSMIETNVVFITCRSNSELATQTVYTDRKSPEEVAEEIIKRLG